jgi:hypothetical protein
MNHPRRMIVLGSVAMLLAASAPVLPQQTSTVLLSASGVADVTLKLKAFAEERRFVIRATGDAAVVQNNSSSANPRFSIGIDLAAADADNVKTYGCGVKNTARVEQGIGKLHVETSCEIIVAPEKIVTVSADITSSGGAKPENITLEATSSW